jgi:predicted CoA-binding protein
MLVDLNKIKNILTSYKTIAIVGLSPKASRPSHEVASYLLAAGYRIIPVNPGQSEILGQTCYPNLTAIPEPVDIVDIFRKPADIPPIAAEAIKIKAKVIWMQQGIINHEAADLARQAGLMVVMDRCLKIDHADLAAS